MKESGQGKMSQTPVDLGDVDTAGYHWMHFTAARGVMLKFLKAAKEIGPQVP